MENVPTIPAEEVAEARSNIDELADDIPVTNEPIDFNDIDTDANSVADLTPNEIGNAGEAVVEEALDAAGETFAKTSAIEVRLTNGRTFRMVPDFLVVSGKRTFVDPDGVTQTVLDLRYAESKASRNGLPELDTLSENQAVFLDALLNGEIERLTPIGSRVRDLVAAEEATSIDIPQDGFELFAFAVR